MEWILKNLSDLFTRVMGGLVDMSVATARGVCRCPRMTTVGTGELLKPVTDGR